MGKAGANKQLLSVSKRNIGLQRGDEQELGCQRGTCLRRQKSTKTAKLPLSGLRPGVTLYSLYGLGVLWKEYESCIISSLIQLQYIVWQQKLTIPKKGNQMPHFFPIQLSAGSFLWLEAMTQSAPWTQDMTPGGATEFCRHHSPTVENSYREHLWICHPRLALELDHASPYRGNTRTVE